MDLVTIDVSELIPPQPMTEVLTALSLLRDTQCLKVLHSREPFPLYQQLLTQGWRYLCQPLPASMGEFKRFEIFIYKSAQQQQFDCILKDLLDANVIIQKGHL